MFLLKANCFIIVNFDYFINFDCKFDLRLIQKKTTRKKIQRQVKKKFNV